MEYGMWVILVVLVILWLNHRGGEWVVRMKTYCIYCCIIGCKDTLIYHMVPVCENKCGTPMLTWKILGSCTSEFKTGLRI